MKIFCIGFNKTGTTSQSKLFLDEGLKIAPEPPFASITSAYFTGNDSESFNKKVIAYIKQHFNDCEFFQDTPFYFPGMYIDLYEAFPNAKFILSVRNSPEDWYYSLINFYATHWGPDKLYEMKTRIPWIYQVLTKIYGGTPEKPYLKKNLIETYEKHNKDAQDFFIDNPNFIKINLSNNEDFLRLEDFIGIKFKSDRFPHVNQKRKNLLHKVKGME